MAWQVAAAPASDGNTYNWYQQDRANSCACACIAMVAHQVKNKNLDEALIRRWAGQAEGSANITKEGIRDYGQAGTALDIIGTVLSENLNIITLLNKRATTITRSLRQATPTKPIIVGVAWYTIVAGAPQYYGGHAVLAVNYHNNHAIFLDPEYGVYEIPQANLNSYDINYGGGVSTGTIFCVRT